MIFRRRGGDDLVQNHVRWAKTVPSSPDIIEMTFSPITSLIEGITGKEHLTRAINLYLECEEIDCFGDNLKFFFLVHWFLL